MGFEPMTCGLRNRCSTTEPRWHALWEALYSRLVTNVVQHREKVKPNPCVPSALDATKSYGSSAYGVREPGLPRGKRGGTKQTAPETAKISFKQTVASTNVRC